MSSNSTRADTISLRGVLLLLVTILMWAMGPLFIKYFAGVYNVWTQNAFRYSATAVMLLVWMGARGQLRYRLTRTQWAKLAIVTAANILMQVCYAATYYFIYPSVGSLVCRVNIIFVTILSFLIFHDERAVIRSPRFLAGSALALAGVCTIIIGRDPELLRHLNITEGAFWIGVSFSVGFALFGAMYALAIKHAVRDIPTFISFTHVSWMTAVGLCIPMFLFGGVTDLWRQPVLPLGLMVLTAFLFIVVAHTCYYEALREIKAVVVVSVTQLIPVFTCLFSAGYYGDTLTFRQLLGGAAVLLGAWLAALAQAKEEQA